MYKIFFKRCLDLILSLCAFIVLFPVFFILIIAGTIFMRGNPFFIQERPGKGEKIFKLIKFRTMDNRCDKNGDLLPDSIRLNKYGKVLRSTSLDELPELINIIKGDMSIVGPRPLAVQYLPFYNDEERKRHSVLPGLTGLAQISGRNAANWPERFAYDLEYINNISFLNDCKIIMKTFGKVLQRGDITVRGTGKVVDFDKYRQQEWEENKKNGK